jgi:hypothetical protein
VVSTRALFSGCQRAASTLNPSIAVIDRAWDSFVFDAGNNPGHVRQICECFPSNIMSKQI